MEQQSKDLDLLDLAVLVAARAKLLIGAMVIGALLAIALSYLLPRDYTSHSVVHFPRPLYVTEGLIMGSTRIVVQTPLEAAKVMQSPLVLDPVVLKYKLGEHESLDSARKRFAKKMSVTVGPDYLLTLTVTAASPRQAQEIAGSILETWLDTTQPSSQERAELEGLHAQARVSLSVVNRLVERLDSESSPRSQQAVAQDESGASLAMALAMQAHLQRQVAAISSVMRGMTRDVLKQAPTLPSVPDNAPAGLLGLLGALLGGGLALLWVVLMDAWKRSSENPVFADRLRRLRYAGKRD